MSHLFIDSALQKKWGEKTLRVEFAMKINIYSFTSGINYKPLAQSKLYLHMNERSKKKNDAAWDNCLTRGNSERRWRWERSPADIVLVLQAGYKDK